MTVTTLRAQDVRSDAHTLGGSFLVDEPTVTVTGGLTAIGDGSDATFVSLDAGQPNLGVSGNAAHTPGLVAHLPPIPTLTALNSLSLTIRAKEVDNAWTITPYLYGHFRLFRYNPGGTLPDPYEITDTSTIYSQDFLGSAAPAFTDFTFGLGGYVGSFLASDFTDGKLYVSWTQNQPLGNSNIAVISEISALVDWTGAAQRLRQIGSPDASRHYPQAHVDGSRQVGQVP